MIAVIGATGRTGRAVCAALAAAGRRFVPVVRDPVRWAATGLPGAARLADLADGAALRAALADADQVVGTAHARFVPAVLEAAPDRASLVLLGSTRGFSRWPDTSREEVRQGEAAFLGSGRGGVMLHPTMVYGAAGEDNVQRLAALLRRLPVAPLPGGGRALVQPIHADDLLACVLAALDRDWAGPEALVVAGPAPLAYRDFLAAVARAAGLRPRPVVPVPAALLMALAPLARRLPGLPTIRVAEIRRLTEDKAFDVGPMRARLGVTGRSLEAGLAQTFRRA